MENVICGYDGFKLFIPGEVAINHVVRKSKDFNLIGRFSVHSNKPFDLPMKGEYGEKYKLQICCTVYQGIGKGVEIKGSFHKLYTCGENHSKYYWPEFLHTVVNLCMLFDVKPEDINVVSLELGLNISIPKKWGVTAKDIIRNILTYKGGAFKNRTDIDHKEEGYYLQFGLVQYLLKIYDKAMQNGLTEERILRYEIKVLQSAYLKPLGIATVQDLINYEKHQKLANELSKLFAHLVIYQDEANDCLLLPEKKVYTREYNKTKAWEDLHDEDRHGYKNMKNAFEALVASKCSINYKKELQALITAAIWHLLIF